MTISVALLLATFAVTPEPPSSIAVLVLSGQNSNASPEELRSVVTERLEANTSIEISDYRPEPAALIAFRACAGDGKCFAEALIREAVQVDLLLMISVDNLGNSRLLGLRLVDVARTENVAVVGEEVPAGTSVTRAVRDRLVKVFPSAWWAPHGLVEVVSVPTGAKVVSGHRSCVTPCRLRLKYGTHTVSVRAPDHEPLDKQVNVMAAVPVQLAAELEPTSSLLSSPWLWGGIVATAVIVGSVSAVALTRGGDPEAICIARTLEACDNL